MTIPLFIANNMASNGTMAMSIKSGIKELFKSVGYDIVRHSPDPLAGLPPDLSDLDKTIINTVRPFTMTSVERLAALLEAVDHISSQKIRGAIVECGVWRGGSTMAALLRLKSHSDVDRDVFLYDTFEGMPPPTETDKSFDGVSASKQLATAERGTGVWCYASLDDVRANVRSTGYPPERVRLIQGKVEETIPKTLPGPIAILRLDTDWYESTKHELQHLFPLLDPKGVLIIDDYGHWEGARKAVDEYFGGRRKDYYFHRIDYTGRLIMKMSS